MPIRLVERVLIPVGFVLAALSFLLPFAAQRLSDPMIVAAQTWSGLVLTVGGPSRGHLEVGDWDAATGRYVLQDLTGSVQGEFGGSDVPIAPAQPGFVLAALLILGGLVAAIFAGSRLRLLISAIAAFGAVVALGLAEGAYLRGLVSPAAYEIPADGQPAADIGTLGQPTTVYGYWFAIGVLAALGLTAAVLYLRSRRTESDLTETAADPGQNVIELTT